jgi:hypothetical protein
MEASQAAVVTESGGREGAKGRFEVGLEMEKLLQPHQFDRLNNPGIADDAEVNAAVFALLHQKHKGSQTGGVDEINATQIQHKRLGEAAPVVLDEIQKLLLGIGIQLTGELEHQITVMALKAPPQRHGQSLKVRDSSNPRFETIGEV